MKKYKFFGDIIKGTIIILIAAFVFYWVCPKYDFHELGEDGAFFINKITGQIYVYLFEDKSVYKLDVDWKSYEQLQEKIMIEALKTRAKEWQEDPNKLYREYFKKQLEDANERAKSLDEQVKELFEKENNHVEDDPVVK